VGGGVEGEHCDPGQEIYPLLRRVRFRRADLAVEVSLVLSYMGEEYVAADLVTGDEARSVLSTALPRDEAARRHPSVSAPPHRESRPMIKQMISITVEPLPGESEPDYALRVKRLYHRWRYEADAAFAESRREASGKSKAKGREAKSSAAAEGPDDDAPTVAVLFDPEPDTWGLRGDPYLWRALRKRLANEPMPGSPDKLARVLRATFEELTGTALADDSAEDIYREEFAHGGMSSGMISLETWRRQLVPTLVQRATTLLSA
jgi:hypothetical protein